MIYNSASSTKTYYGQIQYDLILIKEKKGMHIFIRLRGLF